MQPFYLEQTDSSINPDTGVFAPYKTKTRARRADGVTVVVDGLGRALPARSERTIWKAPALACEELYDTAERVQADGSLALTMERTTTYLERGEPDPRLFTVDADYAESKPSVALTSLIRTLGAADGISITPEHERNLRREGEELDRRYQSPSARKP